MNNTIMTIEDKVKEVISQKLGLVVEKIGNHKSFVGDLGADSLDLVELIMAIEDEFNIEIEDDVAQTLTTVSSVVEYVTGALHTQNA